jgi:hypothetical protein
MDLVQKRNKMEKKKVSVGDRGKADVEVARVTVMAWHWHSRLQKKCELYFFCFFVFLLHEK